MELNPNPNSSVHARRYENKKFHLEGKLTITEFNSITFVSITYKGNSSTTTVLNYVHSIDEIIRIQIFQAQITITDINNQCFTYKFSRFTPFISTVCQLLDSNPNFIFNENTLTYFNNSQTKICFLTIGSRGDVEPMVILALGFKQKNYKVKIITHSCFESTIRAEDIEFAPLSLKPKDLLELCSSTDMFSLDFIVRAKKIFLDNLPTLLTECWEGCKDANILISTPTAVAGYHIAESLDIPYFNIFTMPVSTSEGENILSLTNPDFNSNPLCTPWYELYTNRVMNLITDKMMWLAYSHNVNNWRQTQLNLPPKLITDSPNFLIESQRIMTLYVYSHVVSGESSTPKSNILISGYVRDTRLNAHNITIELNDFILAHSPDIAFVSFGSVPIQNANAFYDLFISSCLENGYAVIINKGWTTVSENNISNPKVLYVSSVPYSYLFPKIKIAIHHGGAGTTASCIYNSVPMIIIPFFGDQYFWGNCVINLSIGNAVRHDLVNSFLISELIEQITKNYDMYLNAVSKLKDKLLLEDGIENSVSFVEKNMLQAYVPPTLIPDNEFIRCSNEKCNGLFTIINRKHHCRHCGKCFCSVCANVFASSSKYRLDDVRMCSMCVEYLDPN